MTYFKMSPAAVVLVYNGIVTVRIGRRELQTDMLPAIAKVVFDLASIGTSEVQLTEATVALGIPKNTAQRLIAELLANGVILSAGYMTVAEAFHEASSSGRNGDPPSWVHPTSDAPRQGIDRGGNLGVPLGDAVGGRRSIRSFKRQSITLDELMDVLWAGCGHSELGRSTIPSAGSLGGLRTFVLPLRVSNTTNSIYEFRDDRLLAISASDNLSAVVGFAMQTRHVDYSSAAAVILLVGRFDWMCRRYGERGYRYVLIESGHAAQNMLLACCSLGLGAVPVGAFDDSKFNKLIGVKPPAESTAYAVVLGHV